MNYFKKIGVFLSAIVMSGCSSASFYAANYPVDKSTLNFHEDVAYGNAEAQKLNIYSDKKTSEKLPVIVFFYGGGYSDGDKDDYLFVADYFAKLGYVAVLPDYSKYPQVKFPVFVEDGAKAVAWVKHNIAKYNGDNENIIVAGHSAGAHIGSLITYDEGYGVAGYINAFVGLAGPYSFTPRAEKYKKIFEPPENYKNMQVDNFVDGDEPPALLLWGNDDEIVGKQNIDKLEAEIKQKNGQVEAIIFDDLGHVGLVSAFTEIRKNEAVRNAVSNFLASLPKK